VLDELHGQTGRGLVGTREPNCMDDGVIYRELAGEWRRQYSQNRKDERSFKATVGLHKIYSFFSGNQ
jgi:hypothetical protein